MTKKGTPLAGAADLQRKLTQMAQAQQGNEPEEAAEESPPQAEEKKTPAKTPKRRRGSARSTSGKRPAARRKPKGSTRPADIAVMLAEGNIDEAVDFTLKALAEDDTGSRHAQVKMPAWLHREWSIYVASQGREVREVLLSIILEKLAEGDDDA